MITSPEEYVKYLWGIEEWRPKVDDNGNPILDENGEPVMELVNPYNNQPILSVILPSDERTFEVDLKAKHLSDQRSQESGVWLRD